MARKTTKKQDTTSIPFVGDDDHLKMGIPAPTESRDCCRCQAHKHHVEDTNDGEKKIEVTLKFYLPDHAEEFEAASRAGDTNMVIYNLLSAIRSSLKHGADFHGMSVRNEKAKSLPGVFGSEKPIHPKVYETLEQVQKFLVDEYNEKSLKLPY